MHNLSFLQYGNICRWSVSFIRLQLALINQLKFILEHNNHEIESPLRTEIFRITQNLQSKILIPKYCHKITSQLYDNPLGLSIRI
jgi:hypothetical protein